MWMIADRLIMVVFHQIGLSHNLVLLTKTLLLVLDYLDNQGVHLTMLVLLTFLCQAKSTHLYIPLLPQVTLLRSLLQR